ncbi:shikimate kinase [Maribacter sp. MAR_2009_72]|uniref:shikimate kinase n=1 Tax=Maribacter sp. MAR_2009_72 TaxID=1250050 RepID=UPI00119BEDF8|nr:shikimate kinase [Maribacter sp. MAR_2009_72]TVZ17327.1 shikimate kinase [Maribacter sp. MAR_2009_72]
MKIVLLGYMGSGKTTIGRIVANHLGIKFLDLDEYIEEQEKMTVANIFRERGELYFRKKEREYLADIFLRKDNFVLSLGGGTPCFGDNMQLVNKQTKNSFYLNIHIDELTNRLKQEKEHRPMIAHLANEEVQEFIGKHLFERSYFYNMAHQKIKGNQRTPSALAEEIIGMLV